MLINTLPQTSPVFTGIYDPAKPERSTFWKSSQSLRAFREVKQSALSLVADRVRAVASLRILTNKFDPLAPREAAAAAVAAAAERELSRTTYQNIFGLRARTWKCGMVPACLPAAFCKFTFLSWECPQTKFERFYAIYKFMRHRSHKMKWGKMKARPRSVIYLYGTHGCNFCKSPTAARREYHKFQLFYFLTAQIFHSEKFRYKQGSFLSSKKTC